MRSNQDDPEAGSLVQGPNCGHHFSPLQGVFAAGDCRINGALKEDDLSNSEKANNGENDTNDAVNHPKHYNSDPSGIECITITRHRNFCVGNAMKYLWRAGLKDEPGNQNKHIEDLKKSIWYINDEIERLKSLGS